MTELSRTPPTAASGQQHVLYACSVVPILLLIAVFCRWVPGPPAAARPSHSVVCLLSAPSSLCLMLRLRPPVAHSRPRLRPLAAAAATAPAAAVPLRDAATLRLLSWARAAGLQAEASLTPALFGSLRGAAASRELTTDAPLASVPHSAALEVTSAARRPLSGFPRGCDTAAFFRLPWYARLALSLLRERSLGDASPFAAYVATLGVPAHAAALGRLHAVHAAGSAAGARRRAEG